MLIHCIQKYVLFIARLKGFYFTYYEGKNKAKQKTTKKMEMDKKTTTKKKKLFPCDLGGPLLAFVINEHYKQTCSMA